MGNAVNSVSLGLIANFLGRGSAILNGLLFTPIYIRLLGVEAFGLIGFYLTLQATLSFLELGLGRVCIREIARLNNSNAIASKSNAKAGTAVRTLEIIYYFMAVMIGVGLAALAPFFAQEWITAENITISELTKVITIIALVIALRWPMGLYGGVLMGKELHVKVNVLKFLVSFISNFGAVLLLYFYFNSVLTYFMWQLVMSIIGLLAYAVIAWSTIGFRYLSSRFSYDFLRSQYSFILGVGVSTMLGSILMQADKLILSKLLSLESYSYYMIVMVLTKPLLMVATSVSTVMYPRAARLIGLGNNKVRLWRKYVNLSYFGNALIIPLAMVILLNAREILQLYTGKSDFRDDMVIVLGIIAIGKAIRANKKMPYILQMAYGKMGLNIKLDIISMLYYIPVVMFLTNHYGVVGAAAAWTSMSFIYFTFGTAIMHRMLNFGSYFFWVLETVIKPIFVSTVILLFVKYLGDIVVYSSKYGVLVTIVFGVFVSFISLVLTDSYARRSAFSLLKKSKLLSNYLPTHI